MRLALGLTIIGTILALCSTGAWAADAAAGKAVYTAKCKACHGDAGQGKMKPVGGLAGADLDNVVAYVHSLKK